MSMHPSLRRSAPRPSNAEPTPLSSPTAATLSLIKEEQVEYKVNEPPPNLAAPSPSHSHSQQQAAPIIFSTRLSASNHPSLSTNNTSPNTHNATTLAHSSKGHQPPQSIRAVVQSSPDEFIHNIYPNETQAHFRAQLRRDVISTNWWLHNLMEPSRDLCAFIPRMNDNQFHCTSCGKKFTRVDRAVDHFRVHIDHRPYQCSGEDGCGFANCKLGFFTKDCLKAHCARTEVTCDRCGTTVEDKNLARHQNTRKCRRV